VLTFEELLAQVSARYDRLDLPSWPDPHPGHQVADDDYERLTDPERYRIVHARARAWTDVLRRRPDVTVTWLAGATVDDRGHPRPFDRGVQITSSRDGTLSLRLLEKDPDPHGTRHALLYVAVGPGVLLDLHPDCGCDACDSGSEDLLAAIDQTIRPVVAARFVVIQGDGWQFHWHPEGSGSWASGPAIQRVERNGVSERCRRFAEGEPVDLPADAVAYVGRSWLD
jgi:hypothetical protein